MKPIVEAYIDQANLFLRENLVEKSIESYEAAINLADSVSQQIYLCNTLGILYQQTGNTPKAIETFNTSIALYKDLPEDLFLDKAAVFNNLATAYLATNPALAIKNYLSALYIYTQKTDSGDSAFYPHLANTHFALGETYQHKQDLHNAKTHFKAAVKIHNQLGNSELNEFKASAHYQLGNIFMEEFNLFDAQTNYTKSLRIFQKLVEQGYEKFKPFLAAVLNNLGVTYKSMGEFQKAYDFYEQALGEYTYLARHQNNLFLPYVAATLNSLSILFAEQKEFTKAIDYCHQTIDVYNNLADDFPDEYTPYLATALHNLGLFYFETKTTDSAEIYFKQALHIRKKLATNQPDAFDADVCATALNLVELYQGELEKKLDLNYKNMSIDLLIDVSERLQKLSDNRPVLMSMKSDCHYYTDYFSQISLAQLRLTQTYKKINALTEDIHSTIRPVEKIVFQNLIVVLLEEQLAHLPQDEKLRDNLAEAYNNLSWLHLQLNQPEKAEEIILKAQTLLKSLTPSLQCNLAHSFLLQNRVDEAKKQYDSLFHQNSDDKEAYSNIIRKDFEKLKNQGVFHQDFEKIIVLFSVKMN